VVPDGFPRGRLAPLLRFQETLVTEAGADPDVCSAKGCQAPATWELLWNNPKLHTADRRKSWTACEEHLAYLRGFLDTRGFLREVLPMGDARSTG
jgi:hypothetical protein